MLAKHIASGFAFAATLILAAGGAMAAGPPVAITGAWARATAPGQTDGVVYMSLTSAAGDELTGAETTDADMAMLHSTTQSGGMSGMQDMDSLKLPPGKTVTLAPHGMHLMLMGLKHPLKAGQVLQLELDFRKAGKTHVTVPVQPLGASGPPR